MKTIILSAFFVFCVGVITWDALSQIEPTPTPTVEQVKRAATIDEFGNDYFGFASAFHSALWAQLQDGKITAANYAAFSHAFWAAMGENPTNDFAALYDDANEGTRLLLQATALKLARARQARTEASAAAIAKKATDLEAKE